jgi:hypothetical protein
MMRLQVVSVEEVPEETHTGRPKPRSKWAMNTTRSSGSGAGTVSPAGSRHATPSELFWWW